MIDKGWELGYQFAMEPRVSSREMGRGYYTAPWRKARICARFVLHPELARRPRYAKIASALVTDPAVTNRLIAQAVAHLKGKRWQRDLAT